MGEETGGEESDDSITPSAPPLKDSTPTGETAGKSLPMSPPPLPDSCPKRPISSLFDQLQINESKLWDAINEFEAEHNPAPGAVDRSKQQLGPQGGIVGEAHFEAEETRQTPKEPQ